MTFQALPPPPPPPDTPLGPKRLVKLAVIARVPILVDSVHSVPAAWQGDAALIVIRNCAEIA